MGKRRDCEKPVSIRHTNRKLTGRTRYSGPEVVLGYRESGVPGVTVSIDWETYGCFADPEQIETLIADLQVALEHLRGPALP